MALRNPTCLYFINPLLQSHNMWAPELRTMYPQNVQIAVCVSVLALLHIDSVLDVLDRPVCARVCVSVRVYTKYQVHYCILNAKNGK